MRFVDAVLLESVRLFVRIVYNDANESSVTSSRLVIALTLDSRFLLFLLVQCPGTTPCRATCLCDAGRVPMLFSCCQDVIAPFSREQHEYCTHVSACVADEYKEGCYGLFHVSLHLLLLQCGMVHSVS